MPTFIREPYPEAKKLSKPNVAMWTHYMQYKMMDWPDLESAIQSKRKYVIERPQRDSCWSGTFVRKYSLNPLDLSAIEPASMERWARDMDRYTPHSRKMKHTSTLSSDPRSQKKLTSFFAPILATSQPATTPSRTISTLSAWSSTLAPAASALHKALRSRSSPALGLTPSISSKTSSSTNASRYRLCLTSKVPTPSMPSSDQNPWKDKNPNRTFYQEFKKALRDDEEHRSNMSLNRFLSICEKLIYKWQRAAFTRGTSKNQTRTAETRRKLRTARLPGPPL
jgi:hypothetical protein